MLTYIWKVHKPAICAYLTAFIILIFLTILLLTVDFSDYTGYSRPLLVIIIDLYYKSFIPLLLVITAYMFTSSRYEQMLIILGKVKTIKLQYLIFTLVLFTTPIINFLFDTFYTNSGYIIYGRYMEWLIAITGLTIYHLIAFSDFKYKSYLFQGSIYVSISLVSLLAFILLQTSMSFLYSQVYTTSTISSAMAPLVQANFQLTTLPNVLLSPVPTSLIVILIFSSIELMKVGRSWKN